MLKTEVSGWGAIDDIGYTFQCKALGFQGNPQAIWNGVSTKIVHQLHPIDFLRGERPFN